MDKAENKEEIKDVFSYIVPNDDGIDNIVNYIKMKIERCTLKIKSKLHKES